MNGFHPVFNWLNWSYVVMPKVKSPGRTSWHTHIFTVNSWLTGFLNHKKEGEFLSLSWTGWMCQAVMQFFGAVPVAEKHRNESQTTARGVTSYFEWCSLQPCQMKENYNMMLDVSQNLNLSFSLMHGVDFSTPALNRSLLSEPCKCQWIHLQHVRWLDAAERSSTCFFCNSSSSSF